MTTTVKADKPLTIEHKVLVDYAFNHWLECMKLGIKPKTICVLGNPGIGKSAAADAIADRMTDYVRAHPEVIFGVGSMAEAVVLLTQERLDSMRVVFDSKNESRPLSEVLPEEVFERKVARLKPITEADVLAICEILDFTSKLPEDLGGLPFRNGDFVDYCPQRWVDRLCRKHAFGVYVQDDLPASAPSMQTAGRQAALERRIHEHKFANGILVMVTGNRREDKSAASTLPAHFRNSVTLLAIEPSLEEWRKWYGRQVGCDPIVAAFLTWKQDLLTMLPKDADKLGAFATPRSWTSLGQQFKVALKCGNDVLFAVAQGLVGKGNASTFCGFVEIRNQLVDPEKVFDDPEGAFAAHAAKTGEDASPSSILDGPSKQIAMACALGEIAAQRWKKGKGKKKSEAPVKLLRSLAFCMAGVEEYTATGVQTFLDNGGNLTAIARVARDYRTDPVIGRMLDHIKAALLGGA